jgi:hypothetical protein
VRVSHAMAFSIFVGVLLLLVVVVVVVAALLLLLLLLHAQDTDPYGGHVHKVSYILSHDIHPSIYFLFIAIKKQPHSLPRVTL